MTGITHPFVSGVSEGSDPTLVGPNEWNAGHAVDSIAPSGLTGSTAASRYVGGTVSGPPITGAHLVGDWCVDQAGVRWTCTVAATPGTWAQEPGTGGSGTPASTVTGPDAFGDPAVVGTATDYARADHDHGLPSAPSGSFSAGGDLSGTESSQTVIGIQGTPVDALPTDATEYLDGTGHWTTPPGTGGGSSTVINVLDYGAVEDFSTDNATAFAAAVAAMVPGCTLLFPSLTGSGYKTSATISITQRGCLITGTGSAYGTRIHMTTSNTTLLSVIPTGLDGTRDQTNLIRSLLLTGPGSATSGRAVYASSDVNLENVGMAGFYDGLYWGTATFYSRAYGCFITDMDRAGVVMDSVNNCTLDTCRITGDFGAGGLIGPVQRGVFIGCTAPTGLALRIVNSSIEYFSQDGIYASGGLGLEISGCYFETQESSTGYAHVNLGTSNGSKAVFIHGNYFQGDGTAGFLAIKGTTTDRVTVQSNYFGINAAIGIDASGGGNTNWLVVNNVNSPAGTFSLPATGYTLDPGAPPLEDHGVVTYLDATDGTAPADPSSGARLYAKAGRFYSRDSGGVEYGPFDAAGAGTGFFTYDQLFPGSSLPSGWTFTGSGSCVVSGGVALVTSGAQSDRLMHALSPDSCYVAQMHVQSVSGVGGMPSLVLLDSSGNGWGVGPYNDGNTYIWDIAAYAYVANWGSLGGSPGLTDVWLQVMVIAGYATGAAYSTDSGTTWVGIPAGASIHRTITQWGLCQLWTTANIVASVAEVRYGAIPES